MSARAATRARSSWIRWGSRRLRSCLGSTRTCRASCPPGSRNGSSHWMSARAGRPLARTAGLLRGRQRCVHEGDRLRPSDGAGAADLYGISDFIAGLAAWMIQARPRRSLRGLAGASALLNPLAAPGSPAIAGLTFQKGGLDSTLKGSPERHPALQTEPQREVDDPRLPS